jgi:hypothetical protein
MSNQDGTVAPKTAERLRKAMTWETAWAEAALARRFVERLSDLRPPDLQPAVPPILQSDPYLSAWTNVQAALGNTPETDQIRLRELLTELDGLIAGLQSSPALAEAARRATRALIARRWLLTEESLRFVYEPFESLVPLSSLRA